MATSLLAKEAGVAIEKGIIALVKGLDKAEEGIDKVVYGLPPDPTTGIKFPGNDYKTNGLLPILREINKIDLCNVINYVLGNINLSDIGDENGVFQKKLKKLQKSAKDVSSALDLDFTANLYDTDHATALTPEAIAVYNSIIENKDGKSTPEDISKAKAQLRAHEETIKENRELEKQQAEAKAIQEISDPESAEYKEAQKILDKTSAIQRKNKRSEKIRLLIDSIKIIGDEMDDDILLIFPKLTNLKTNLQDIVATIQQYSAVSITYQDFNNIPNSDVQTIMTKLQEVKRVCDIIASLTTVGGVVNRLIPNQIQQLQKILDPSQLLFLIRLILNLAKFVRAIVAKVLAIIKIIRATLSVIAFLIKVCLVLLKFFGLNPYPLAFSTAGIMSTLETTKTGIAETLFIVLQRVNQFKAFIDVIIAFVQDLVDILDEIIAEIETLIFNLEACNAVADSAMVARLKSTKGELMGLYDELNNFAERYTQALGNTYTRSTGFRPSGSEPGSASRFGRGRNSGEDGLGGRRNNIFGQNGNTKTWNGFILVIEEEEVVDKAIRNKRRRAVAYNGAGVMIAASELTFATNDALLFQELQFKLVREKLTSDVDFNSNVGGIDDLQDALGILTTDEAVYNSLGINTTRKAENAAFAQSSGTTSNDGGLAGSATGTDSADTPIDPIAEQRAMQEEMVTAISAFIGGLPGGNAIKKKTRETVDAQQQQLKKETASGVAGDTSGQAGFAVSGVNATTDRTKPKYVTESKNPNLLTKSEKKKYEHMVATTPSKSKLHQAAKAKLDAHAEVVRSEGLVDYD